MQPLHSGNGFHMDIDKLAQRVIRPAVEVSGCRAAGGNGFRRGLASHLYELGANEKIVQCVLRRGGSHAWPDGTSRRLIRR